MRWVIYVFVVLLIALVPCVIFPELIVPFDNWEAWESWHNGHRVQYSGNNLPPAIRVEMPVFTAIVLPPQWIAEKLGYHRTMYGGLAASYAGLDTPGSSFHYTPPPIIAAREHLVIAVPFWLAVIAGACEAIRAVVGRRKSVARIAA